jgi:IS1 family transposase
MVKKKIQQLPKFEDTVKPCQPGDIIEYDEVWSYVQNKDNQCWLFTAMCRRTRQIVGFALGERNLITCALVWKEMPFPYTDCQSFSDFFYTYSMFPNNTPVSKQSGETAHMERWNNTLRQRLGRYVRKTLSFSKSRLWHELVTKWFILEYNLSHQS